MRKPEFAMVVLLVVLAIILLFIGFLLVAYPAHGQAACAYQSSGQFVMVDDPQIENVSIDQLASIDAYLRNLYTDTGRDHVLMTYSDPDEVSVISGVERDWSGSAGFTFLRRRWNWETCQVDRASRVKVDLVLAMPQGDDDTEMFGLVVHELSHASLTEDSPAGQVLIDTGSWWRRVAMDAYANRCSQTLWEGIEYCQVIRDILDA